MKRLMIAALALIMSICLCACGSSQTPAAEGTNPQPLSPVMDTAPASDSSAAEPAALPPASETDAQPEETSPSRYTEAQEYIGRSAAELIAALGEPQSSEYASSCDVENAEDGMLQYDGFYVWTLKTADEELVRDVYPDD